MKCCWASLVSFFLPSLPPRGAWIEILLPRILQREQEVAPPTGSVD